MGVRLAEELVELRGQLLHVNAHFPGRELGRDVESDQELTRSGVPDTRAQGDGHTQPKTKQPAMQTRHALVLHG
jgi:hypothetical protein